MLWPTPIFFKQVFRTKLFTHNLILLFYCIFHHKLICKIKNEIELWLTWNPISKLYRLKLTKRTVSYHYKEREIIAFIKIVSKQLMKMILQKTEIQDEDVMSSEFSADYNKYTAVSRQLKWVQTIILPKNWTVV